MTGDRMRAVRSSLGLTQAELGAWIGRNGPTISLYETGRREIPKAIALAVEAMGGR